MRCSAADMWVCEHVGDACRLERVFANFLDEAEGRQGAQEVLHQRRRSCCTIYELLVRDGVGRSSECGEDIEVDADLHEGPFQRLDAVVMLDNFRYCFGVLWGSELTPMARLNKTSQSVKMSLRRSVSCAWICCRSSALACAYASRICCSAASMFLMGSG
jgi:hypothetical protein